MDIFSPDEQNIEEVNGIPYNEEPDKEEEYNDNTHLTEIES